MNKQEKLITRLAKAEAVRAELEAALAKAEAALVNTVTNAATIDRDRAEAIAKVVKARAQCRQLRLALVELNRQESKVWPDESINTPLKQPGDLSGQGASANPATRQLSEDAGRGESERSEDESQRRKPVPRGNNAIERSPLLRQATSLFALELAYLQYYYFDVQLQIMSLPSVTLLPLQ